MQPGDADAVAEFQMCNSWSKRNHSSRSFVSGDKRKRRFHRPVTVCGVQISVTNSTRRYFHERLSRSRSEYRNFPDNKWLTEFLDHCGLHSFWYGHDESPYRLRRTQVYETRKRS